MAEPKKTKVYTSHKVTQVVATLFVAMPCHATSHTRLVYGNSEAGCLPHPSMIHGRARHTGALQNPGPGTSSRES